MWGGFQVCIVLISLVVGASLAVERPCLMGSKTLLKSPNIIMDDAEVIRVMISLYKVIWSEVEVISASSDGVI